MKHVFFESMRSHISMDWDKKGLWINTNCEFTDGSRGWTSLCVPPLKVPGFVFSVTMLLVRKTVIGPLAPDMFDWKRYRKFFLILLLMLPAGVHASDKDFDPFKAGCVGVGMFTSSLFMANENLPWGHVTELQGWSFCWTEIGFKFLPPDYNFLSPVYVGLFDIAYHFQRPDKILADLSGVAGSCILNLNLDGPKKDITAFYDGEKLILTARY